MIDYSLNALFRAVGVSKQSVHQSLQRQKAFDNELTSLVLYADKLRKNHPGCGVQKMYDTLKPVTMGRDKFCEIFLSLGYGVKQISKNIVHQERFYVSHSTYDQQHKIHAILYKALKLLQSINSNGLLISRIGALQLNFPEQKDISISEASFEKIVFNRKSEPYRNALEIARLLLLNYHPDLSYGTNNVLALMFDMNLLWEKFVYASLRKNKAANTTIFEQNSKLFWKPTKGNRSKMKPDIVINKDTENCVVLDTKWKNINGNTPSAEDLRQLFVYSKYYGAKKVALIYPGPANNINSGTYYNHQNPAKTQELGEEECAIITLACNNKIDRWQQEICETVIAWAEEN